MQAVLKQAAVPVHQKVTSESAAAPGKPMQNEMIRLGDTLTCRRAPWMARPTTPRRRRMMPGRPYQGRAHCTRVRSEAVDGQPAELYRVQSNTTGAAIRRSGSRPRRPTAAPDLTMLEQARSS